MKPKNPTILGIVIMIGLVVLFGLLGKPTEMGIIVVAGAISLSFMNLDKIQRFKGAGFEAEMKKVVEEANATIDQLREVATTSSEAILTHLMASNFLSGTTLKKRIELHDQIICSLKEIGASEEQIQKADGMWNRGIGIIFHRSIRNKIPGDRKPSEPTVKSAQKELQELLNFDEWQAPSSDEIRALLEAKNEISPEIEELLMDYSEFEQRGTFRRLDVFYEL